VIALADRRRLYAEEIQAIANIRTTGLVDALASVERERFLPPGPWVVRGEADLGGPMRWTPDADARHVYHNLSIAIDPERQLFNGGPGVVAPWIDALGLEPGTCALHVGCGTGYYTALMAACVGPAGRVLAIEVDTALAETARHNLETMANVRVANGDGSGPLGEALDAILVSAGVTHPAQAWLDALAPGGRLLLPLTCTMPQMGPIGKGLAIGITRPVDSGSETWTARVVTPMIAIYSASGLRDARLNDELGRAFMSSPFVRLRAFRRDDHERAASCWFHGEGFCFST
jgi:protein-L-isoaspartate(D-aspartate) O-methyltransferase